MRVYTDKKGISHEETMEFDENDLRDKKVKSWFSKNLKKPNQSPNKE